MNPVAERLLWGGGAEIPKCRFLDIASIELRFFLRESWDIVEMLFLSTFSKKCFGKNIFLSKHFLKKVFYFRKSKISKNKKFQKLFWESTQKSISTMSQLSRKENFRSIGSKLTKRHSWFSASPPQRSFSATGFIYCQKKHCPRVFECRFLFGDGHKRFCNFQISTAWIK